MPYRITDDCVACGTCLEECPNEAIIEDDGIYRITDECNDCGTCIEVCPSGAIIEEE
jgi:NAD-dependent dihydropyrimidine dehydrogenase PreA subunit